MKSLFIVLIVCVFSISNAKAMDPRIKAMGAMALYGTVGGALLGTASLAFGTGGRAVAKGASLGLYAGLIFGSYVIVSHAYRKHQRQNPEPQDNYYPGVQSPYETQSGGGGYYEEDPQGGYLWNPQIELKLESLRQNSDLARPALFKWGQKRDLNFTMPLFNFSF